MTLKNLPAKAMRAAAERRLGKMRINFRTGVTLASSTFSANVDSCKAYGGAGIGAAQFGLGYGTAPLYRRSSCLRRCHQTYMLT
eukprot:CAMPEP_0113965406 /NCGR_PEP_ID=MMETSP0011_2-20120614/7724_1 /TAXON_ID=101924 /ORGANISM="Rhodosorus marinus" /LENGTH=83 /DNA_ID=CAMNT_0000977909 /DNA_START=748 /DNA_END=995 /DNA_ORIENTATION=- /assembly_acc=CAM_ASM_000156